MKQDLPEESPILWTTQAFSVAAAVSMFSLLSRAKSYKGQIILSLDNFNRNQSAREYEEHQQLITDTISALSSSVAISSIASRGTRLLNDLMAEEHHARSNSNNSFVQNGKQKATGGGTASKNSERSLNVAAFVKKFCESDQVPQPSSPIATSHMPLWLQQDTSFQPYLEGQQSTDALYSTGRGSSGPYQTFQSQAPQPLSTYNLPEPSFQHPSGRRHHDTPMNPFTQHLTDAFDIRSSNWFDDLLGLAPSNSI
jgi:hypothetical protein